MLPRSSSSVTVVVISIARRSLNRSREPGPCFSASEAMIAQIRSRTLSISRLRSEIPVAESSDRPTCKSSIWREARIEAT